MARQDLPVLGAPGNPGAPLIQLDHFSRLVLVPLTATVRLRWPEGPFHPHLLAGAGVLFARHEHMGYTTQGWGAQLRAGAGLDWRRGDRLLLGLEGWWGWGRTDMRQVAVSPLLFSSAPTGQLRSDGLHLLATAGWRL
jgi:hypothetical protein